MLKDKAYKLIDKFKGNNYSHGLNVLKNIGKLASEYGNNVLLVANQTHQKKETGKILEYLRESNIQLAGNRIVPGSSPNTPREDVYRVESYLLHYHPDCIIAFGGGSNIDCVKAANVLATLGLHSPEIDDYFGTGLVSSALKDSKKKLWPFIAIQTSSSSAAHLTKYANVTDPIAGQKKLIVDEAIIPQRPVFDYSVSTSMPESLTIDGALDGIAHTLEVFYGAGEDKFELTSEITATALELIIQNTKKAIKNPEDLEAREALGLATDLGGYAIMVGGTNGAHLTSFSLVDITSHGRACGIMNPYYTVFFAPAIEKQLKVIGEILQRNNLISKNIEKLSGRELGIAVARGLVDFNKSIGAPYKLTDIPGFSNKHIERALNSAKNPQLEMKLKNMPVPLNAGLIDEYMAPVLEAARKGDFSLIKDFR
ncbi:MAG: iron-containing alcohol dehydrogenase [Atribacterota bacterium]|nr:iron-containing alcohol dehydrogenase [Atribacterota bacterium]MDD4289393.1 iron-containing alcohol dehydrogenase [Atribacterota bacterium]MDI9596054.1 iron-containing alcohol dehydrogenase [Atribacterota bacterium]